MATKYRFNNRNIFEPGAYAQIKSGIPVQPQSATFGNVLIIDKGLGQDWGGGSGINGTLTNGKNTVYEFNDITEFRDFANGGVWWDIASYLFNPLPGATGINKLLYVAAKTTTTSNIAYNFPSSVGVGATASIKLKLTALTITAGGTGHVVNDVITLTGGTFTSAIQVRVATVGGGGAITGVSLVTGGSYSVLPTNPVAQGSTTGVGIGATFTSTAWNLESISVLTSGSGYGNAAINITGGGSPTITGAAIANLVAGVVNSITVSIPGAGYTLMPSIAVVDVPAGGTISFVPRTEGTVSNGVIAGSNLAKGYASKLKAGIVDPTKFILTCWKGNFRGVDDMSATYTRWVDTATFAVNNTVIYNGFIWRSLQSANTGNDPISSPTYWEMQTSGYPTYGSSDPLKDSPTLLATSPEFSTLEELAGWMRNDFTFNQSFNFSSANIISNGGLVPADLISNLGYNLSSGGTEVYNASDITDALSQIVEEDYTFILSNDYSTNATSVFNTQLLAHVMADATYDKYVIIGGGNDNTEFQSVSITAGQYFDSSRVMVIHSGEFQPKIGGGVNKYPSLYSAAGVLGRMAGLQPQVPVTYKAIAMSSPVHELTTRERERALDAGITNFRWVPGLNWVVNQGVNTLQKNSQLVNPDGQSHDMTIERIKAQLNKELVINARITFVGQNLNTASPEVLKVWTEGFLRGRTASPASDNLIIDFQDVTVTQTNDSLFINYGFIPNGPVNKLFFTGYILDKNLSA